MESSVTTETSGSSAEAADVPVVQAMPRAIRRPANLIRYVFSFFASERIWS
jgi:hypothetical protein